MKITKKVIKEVEVSTMIYKMKVTITDPNTKDGMFSSLYFTLDCNFVYDPKQYGNGYYVSLENKNFYPQKMSRQTVIIILWAKSSASKYTAQWR